MTSPRIRIEVAGGPEAESRRLAGEIERRGLGDVVRVLGEVADPVACLARWHVLAVPSRREGFGLALIEAMAAGRPVVAARVGGIPGVLDGGAAGVLIPADDPEALAGALRDLAHDPERARRLGRAGRVRVERHYEARETARAWAGIAREVSA